MQVAVVVTTINDQLSSSLSKIDDRCEEFDWRFIVVGDEKTPQINLPHARYLSVEDQKQLPWKSATKLPWNCYARKNIGYLLAWHEGADYILTTDDDNYPMNNWQNLLFSFSLKKGPLLLGKHPFLNPLPFFNATDDVIWPRGLPMGCIHSYATHHNIRYDQIGVVSSLWNGSPDFDACGHILYDDKEWEFKSDLFLYKRPDYLAPYNTQNTMFTRELLPYQFLPVGIARADDIWTSYISQFVMASVGQGVLYISPTTYQQRNEHDLAKDLADERLLYIYTEKLVEALCLVSATNKSTKSYYYDLCDAASKFMPEGYMKSVENWLEDLGV